VIPIRIKNDNCVASLCRAVALSAASRLVLLSDANWNELRKELKRLRIARLQPYLFGLDDMRLIIRTA
jgi:hypothetical protein